MIVKIWQFFLTGSQSYGLKNSSGWKATQEVSSPTPDRDGWALRPDSAIQGFILSGLVNCQGQRLHNLSGPFCFTALRKNPESSLNIFFVEPKSVVFCPSTMRQCKDPAPFSGQSSLRPLLHPHKTSSQPEQKQFPPHSRVHLYTEHSCPGGMLSQTVGGNDHLLWATLLLTQPRTLWTNLAARACCWLRFSMLVTKTLSPFPPKIPQKLKNFERN